MSRPSSRRDHKSRFKKGNSSSFNVDAKSSVAEGGVAELLDFTRWGASTTWQAQRDLQLKRRDDLIRALTPYGLRELPALSIDVDECVSTVAQYLTALTKSSRWFQFNLSHYLVCVRRCQRAFRMFRARKLLRTLQILQWWGAEETKLRSSIKEEIFRLGKQVASVRDTLYTALEMQKGNIMRSNISQATEEARAARGEDIRSALDKGGAIVRDVVRLGEKLVDLETREKELMTRYMSAVVFPEVKILTVDAFYAQRRKAFHVEHTEWFNAERAYSQAMREAHAKFIAQVNLRGIRDAREQALLKQQLTEAVKASTPAPPSQPRWRWAVGFVPYSVLVGMSVKLHASLANNAPGEREHAAAGPKWLVLSLFNVKVSHPRALAASAPVAGLAPDPQQALQPTDTTYLLPPDVMHDTTRDCGMLVCFSRLSRFWNKQESSGLGEEESGEAALPHPPSDLLDLDEDLTGSPEPADETQSPTVEDESDHARSTSASKRKKKEKLKAETLLPSRFAMSSVMSPLSTQSRPSTTGARGHSPSKSLPRSPSTQQPASPGGLSVGAPRLARKVASPRSPGIMVDVDAYFDSDAFKASFLPTPQADAKGLAAFPDPTPRQPIPTLHAPKLKSRAQSTSALSQVLQCLNEPLPELREQPTVASAQLDELPRLPRGSGAFIFNSLTALQRRRPDSPPPEEVPAVRPPSRHGRNRKSRSPSPSNNRASRPQTSQQPTSHILRGPLDKNVRRVVSAGFRRPTRPSGRKSSPWGVSMDIIEKLAPNGSLAHGYVFPALPLRVQPPAESVIEGWAL